MVGGLEGGLWRAGPIEHVAQVPALGARWGLEDSGQKGSATERRGACQKPIPGRTTLPHHTQPGSIYLLTPVGERPIHVGFEVDGGCGVRQPAVHLPALYLTCGREDALEPIPQPPRTSPCTPCSASWSPGTGFTLTVYWLCVVLGKTSTELVVRLGVKSFTVY